MRKMIVVFSGAGLSADSGLPTFRFGKDGLWENHKIEEVGKHDAWFKDRAKVLGFYRDRYNSYSSAEPHAGHKALVELEQKYNVHHFTQNIDNLLEQAGASEVHHIHGNIKWTKCEWHKEIVNGSHVQFQCYYKAPIKENFPEIGDVCPLCGGQLRPDIVLFEEAVPKMNSSIFLGFIEVMKQTDGIFIVCGTSMEVYPAAYIIPYFSQVNRKYLVDPNPSKLDGYKILRGNASEKLPELVDDLMYL